VSRGHAAILRPGHITAGDIALVAGEQVETGNRDAPRAPGTLEAHYAPRTPLTLYSPDDAQARSDEGCVAVLAFVRPSWTSDRDIVRIAPREAHQYAHDLYAALRDLDGSGADHILVETPPADPAWRAVVDRLLGGRD
jgi:L-threonylcarbamoyladenylate synthase